MNGTTLKTIAAIAALAALPAGCVGYARSETHTIYETGTTFLDGYPAVWEIEIDRFGSRSDGKLVGYYGGGNPRVIGFGCDDAKAPVIAMEEDDLSHCERVEPIANHREMLEVR